MKILSEKTGEIYDSVEACQEAERLFDEAEARKEAERKAKADARKIRATEVEDAYKAVIEAKKAYKEKLDAFVKDYGSFHMTLHTGENNPFDLFDTFGGFWF